MPDALKAVLALARRAAVMPTLIDVLEEIEGYAYMDSDLYHARWPEMDDPRWRGCMEDRWTERAHRALVAWRDGPPATGGEGEHGAEAR